jgi:hypothetical protein
VAGSFTDQLVRVDHAVAGSVYLQESNPLLAPLEDAAGGEKRSVSAFARKRTFTDWLEFVKGMTEVVNSYLPIFIRSTYVEVQERVRHTLHHSDSLALLLCSLIPADLFCSGRCVFGVRQVVQHRCGLHSAAARGHQAREQGRQQGRLQGLGCRCCRCCRRCPCARAGPGQAGCCGHSLV